MMMRKLSFWIGPLLLALSASARAQDVLAPLTLTPEAIAAGDIRVETLKAIRQAASVSAFGQVLDPAQLVTLSTHLAQVKAEVAASEAKLNLAQSEAKRAASLFRSQGNVSMADYQAAESAGQVATANLAVAQAKLRSVTAGGRASWGKELMTAIDAGNEPLAGIETGQACLVEVTLPLGANLTTAPAKAVASPASGPTLSLQLVGPSPKSSPGYGLSFYYVGKDPSCPPVGLPLRAHLPSGPEQTGVVVPKSAVVWRAATPIVFLQSATGEFTPTPIQTDHLTPNGYFVRSNGDARLKPGEAIVVTGAALLLSQAETGETGASTGPAQSSDDDD